MTTKADVNLTLSGDRFILNGQMISKKELGMFLERLDFDVDFSDEIFVFFMKTLNSLKQLRASEFFPAWNALLEFNGKPVMR
jgi:hypothetical protein